MKEENALRNQLKVIRMRLGLSQQELASTAGIARQTIGGIEAMLYAPSAMVALRLARALGCRVEEVFWLEDNETIVEAAPVLGMPKDIALRVSLARVDGKWVAHPLNGAAAFRTEMVPADGIGILKSGSTAANVTLLDDPEALARTAVVAGCTPALSLWARSAERRFPGLHVNWRHANSMEALKALARGEIHVAGVHLCNPGTGECNAEYVRKLFPSREMVLVNLGTWKEGLVVAPGNPKGLYSAADLARSGVSIINREQGAGCRILLDSMLEAANVDQRDVAGYASEESEHQEIALAICSGRADAGISTEAIAATFGLDFVPLHEVRYDLVLSAEHLHHEPVHQLLSTLEHRWVRSQLSALCGYDTSSTGEVSPIVPE